MVADPDGTILINLRKPTSATLADSHGLGITRNDDAMEPPSMFMRRESPAVKLSGRFVDALDISLAGLGRGPFDEVDSDELP
jgi:hypothetical protein